MGFGVGVGEAIVWVAGRRGAHVTRGWSFFDDSMASSQLIPSCHGARVESSIVRTANDRHPAAYCCTKDSVHGFGDVRIPVEAQAQRGGGGEANIAADALHRRASARGSLLCFHQISERDMKRLNY
ncbi:unnamed protein product [Musa textilis]